MTRREASGDGLLARNPWRKDQRDRPLLQIRTRQADENTGHRRNENEHDDKAIAKRQALIAGVGGG